MTEHSTQNSKHHNDTGERRKRQPPVETWVGAVTRPARDDLRPVQAAIVKPQPEQQNVGGDQQKYAQAARASAVPSAALTGVVAFANGVIIDFRDAIAAVALLHLDNDINQKKQ